MKKFLYTVWEIAEVFFIALIAVVAIKYFLVQPFIVNGASMEPTFYDGDYLLIDELSYHFKNPERGDVVVFKSPQDGSTYYIKRVIGLPGERVEIQGDMIRLYSNEHPQGLELEEPYLRDLNLQEWQGSPIIITLKDGQYFVLGDNRINSYDSRFWGPLEESMIVGLVKLRLWPLDDVSFFNAVQYAD
ncbi:signal peptidase I [Candidatus Wolfebacteria bacterium RIFCSPHIGHO2_01_FULL_48_22]|uniref:Signal peptidase I n=2 Tax=Candidatus Wolfeibacteriota TaxID=1752735 RepID=A0A1F8DVU7_9BACT|nr:MAG: signal peptidase I [Candidatus Wolfebacteria bacterium RIFCSPHIGHO2_01_FULL_48_22]OGM93560.1 MAG: signal peptidase I [Candidatus Wolfebacteria bacterium RIFCSPLOWO2_01_FULL_47_17b]